MGDSRHIACHDCRKVYYLGYGGYGTWIYANTVEEFDARAKKVVGRNSDDPWTKEGNLRKNQNMRAVLDDHRGHQLVQWCGDYEYGVENGTLYGMGSYGTRGEPLVEEYDKYDHVNMFE